MLYVRSDCPLLELPWNEDDPSFYVTDLADSELRVAIQFSKPFLAHLGAHTGWSSGFCPEKEGDELAARSLADLLAYLLSVTTEGGPVELFACWDGDQEVEPSARHRLSPSDLDVAPLRYVEPPWFAVVEPASTAT
jgi:hypothetical protein